MKSSLSYSLSNQQPSFLTDIWGPLSTPSWECLLPHSWKTQTQITIIKARHTAQRLMNTVHSWTPPHGPSREWTSRFGGQDFREDTTSSLSLEGWPGCQEREMASHGSVPDGICNSCKGEKMLDAIKKKKKGELSGLAELWVCAGESRQGDVLKE